MREGRLHLPAPWLQWRGHEPPAGLPRQRAEPWPMRRQRWQQGQPQQAAMPEALPALAAAAPAWLRAGLGQPQARRGAAPLPAGEPPAGRWSRGRAPRCCRCHRSSPPSSGAALRRLGGGLQWAAGARCLRGVNRRGADPKQHHLRPLDASGPPPGCCSNGARLGLPHPQATLHCALKLCEGSQTIATRSRAGAQACRRGGAGLLTGGASSAATASSATALRGPAEGDHVSWRVDLLWGWGENAGEPLSYLLWRRRAAGRWARVVERRRRRASCRRRTKQGQEQHGAQHWWA